MLTHLFIRNYTLIESLELAPAAGLNIITGETGAGKSILLGAIGLLLGNRADSKTLYDPAQKCVIEGTFTVADDFLRVVFEEEQLDYETNCIIRREISPGGKSRAFVNDTPVTLEVLRRVSAELMDIHSQHDTLLLGSQPYQLQMLDVYGQHAARLHRYKTDYTAYKAAREAHQRLQDEAAAIRKEYDYHRFLLEELDKVQPVAGEQEQMEQELSALENAEEIRQRLGTAHELLQGSEQNLIQGLQTVLASLAGVSRYAPAYADLHARLQSSLIELKDLSGEVEREALGVEPDNERMFRLQERLNLLYGLEQKHGVKSLEELLAVQEDLESKVSRVLNLDEDLERTRREAKAAHARLLASGRELSEARLAIRNELADRVTGLLAGLGIPNGQLLIDHHLTDPGPEGMDAVNLLFSANKGIRPRQLKDVASGGEFSRLMLAVKYVLAHKRALPTIVFDEIDTGVSGETSIQVGNMMRDMAHSHQLIAITHLHQIAAKGHTHFFVYKDHTATRSVSKIRTLSFDERVQEIAQMIGGANPPKGIVENAREMLMQAITV